MVIIRINRFRRALACVSDCMSGVFELSKVVSSQAQHGAQTNRATRSEGAGESKNIQSKSRRSSGRSSRRRQDSRLVQLHIARMIGIVVLSGALLLCIVQLYGAHALSSLYRHQYSYSLALNADQLRLESRESVQGTMKRLLATPWFTSVSLVSQHGRVLLSSQRAGMTSDPFIRFFLPDHVGDPIERQIVIPPEHPLLRNTNRGDTPRSEVLILRAVPDVGFISHQISKTLDPVLFFVAMWVIVVSLLLSFVFLRRLVDPIDNLARAMRRVIDPARKGIKPIPLPIEHRRDEIGAVVMVTNHLLSLLDQAMHRDQLRIKEIKNRDRLFSDVLEHVREGVVCLGEDFRVLQINRRAARLFGREDHFSSLSGGDFGSLLSLSSRMKLVSALKNMTPVTYVDGDPDDVQDSRVSEDALDELLDGELQDGASNVGEVSSVPRRETCSEPGFVTTTTGLRKDGVEVPLNLTVSCYALGSARYYVLVLDEPGWTEEALSETKLNEQRLQSAVIATGCGAWDYDVERDQLWMAPEFWAGLGYSDHDLPRTLEDKYALIHSDDVSWVKSSTERFLLGESIEYNPEYRLQHKDGTWVWVEDRGVVRHNAAGKVVRFSGALTDCSERKRFERQLMYMATHDSLTGLPNRTLLQDRLEHAISSAQRNHLMVGVLLVDVDRFKLINDSLGHEIGDQLIRALAERLQQSVRPMDTLCHLSADEFVVLCEDLPAPQEAARLAKRLISGVHQPFIVDGNQLNISVSIGMSLSPADGDNAHMLLRNADTAMHNAKAAGGSGYRFFVPDMNDAAVERLSMERRLTTALESQQFRLHYQPKVDLKTGALCGVEALIRWPKPGGGYITPDQFIPIAEETGLVMGIGEWVLREALSQICAWRERGFVPVPVAVNLSGKHLVAGGMDELILRMLREFDVPPRLLEIELTESSIMEHMAKAMATLNRLRDAGVGIALDDFGTGYSSLSWLRQLPLTTLKIDRSFVMDIPHKSEANAIAAIILETGRQLGLTVVAEGIEDEDQREFLKMHQCDYGQGWLFSKAVRASVLEKMLQRSRDDVPFDGSVNSENER